MAELWNDLFLACIGGVIAVMEIVDQGVVDMAANRMHEHPRRLVDHHEPFVFVDDIELALRIVIRQSETARQAYLDHIVKMNAPAGLGLFTVDSHSSILDETLEAVARFPGEVADKKTVEALGLSCLDHHREMISFLREVSSATDQELFSREGSPALSLEGDVCSGRHVFNSVLVTSGPKGKNKGFVTVGNVVSFRQLPDLSVVFLVDCLQLLREVAIAKIGTAAERPPLPLDTAAIFPEGAECVVGGEGLGVFFPDVFKLQAGGEESVVDFLKITAISAQPALDSALADLFVDTSIEFFESCESFGRRSIFRFFPLFRMARFLSHKPDYVLFCQPMKEAVIN